MSVTAEPTLPAARVQALVAEIERLSHWFGREEPRRHELQAAIADLRRHTDDLGRIARGVLRCAVTVDRMYSSSLKRLIRNRLAELHRTLAAYPPPSAPAKPVGAQR